MVDLVSKLSELDKKIIHTYIEKYSGARPDRVLPTEEWLQQWSHSNQRLYKLLGNKLQVEIPFSFEAPKEEVRNSLRNLFFENEFCSTFRCFVASHGKGEFLNLLDLVNVNTLYNDKVDFSLSLENNGKRVKIQQGQKPMRALQKVINLYDFPSKTKEDFEEFRLGHSRIFNSRTVNKNIVLSIHPMDYLTMSDNSLNWSSCLSWRKKGVYRIGTIEMMNSNNALCCYVKSDTPFYFADSKKKETTWNNKIWRNLTFITKDIIMCGKGYPFQSLDYSLFVLNSLVKLANENLHWYYQYGPEPYMDMIHISKECEMEVNHWWIYTSEESKKHNIIWDTRGMYNDMLNCPPDNFICVRNKVKRNKIISISGKATCVCCGEYILDDDEGYGRTGDYNDRYTNTNEVVCWSCMSNF